MKRVINIHEFLDCFNKQYDFIYNNNDCVAGFSEAVELFDDGLESNESFKNFVGEFSKFRGDFISSDREAAAFMFALEVMGVFD